MRRWRQSMDMNPGRSALALGFVLLVASNIVLTPAMEARSSANYRVFSTTGTHNIVADGTSTAQPLDTWYGMYHELGLRQPSSTVTIPGITGRQLVEVEHRSLGFGRATEVDYSADLPGQLIEGVTIDPYIVDSGEAVRGPAWALVLDDDNPGDDVVLLLCDLAWAECSGENRRILIDAGLLQRLGSGASS